MADAGPNTRAICEPTILFADEVLSFRQTSFAGCASPFGTATKRQSLRTEFEQHVAWVLGCYGFATIVLGTHEDLVAEETKVKRGSLDLLAYHPIRKLVLLGGCTLNVPKEQDYFSW